MNQPMDMIRRNMLRRFFDRCGYYKYCWLQDCIIYPKLDCISCFKAPNCAGFRSNYLELPNL